MKQFALKFFCLLALTGCGTAWSVTCSITATSIPLSTTYKSGTATQLTGTISGSCTPLNATEASSRPWIYIGLNQGEPPAGRAMTRQNGSETLTYQIYHANYGSGTWTEGAGVASTNKSAGGVVYQMTNTNAAQTFSYAYYFNISTPQASAPAGIYDDLAIVATIRLSNNAGLATSTILSSASFGVSASIVSSCYFSSAPTPLSINYTSFTATPASGTSTFQLSCTYGSPYTLSLDAVPPPSVTSLTTAPLLGLPIQLSLSAGSGTGSAAPQSFSVTGTIAAGQSGDCALGLCSASQPHTVFVGF